mmetsp:Transcript_83999/g.168219  ORF Transcript_83999/g.168219 Transcript_83999/m.168219 type:complete len:110 (+) Transcript_83999:431-760(+)
MLVTARFGAMSRGLTYENQLVELRALERRGAEGKREAKGRLALQPSSNRFHRNGLALEPHRRGWGEYAAPVAVHGKDTTIGAVLAVEAEAEEAARLERNAGQSEGGCSN